MRRVGAVASETAVRENRPNIPVKLDPLRGQTQRRGETDKNQGPDHQLCAVYNAVPDPQKERSTLPRCTQRKKLSDLAGPGASLEALKADRARQYAIRVNQQYRVCFRWKDGAASDVEIVDYH